MRSRKKGTYSVLKTTKSVNEKSRSKKKEHKKREHLACLTVSTTRYGVHTYGRFTTVVFTNGQIPKTSEKQKAEQFYILFLPVRVNLIVQELSTMIVRKIN